MVSSNRSRGGKSYWSQYREVNRNLRRQIKELTERSEDLENIQIDNLDNQDENDEELGTLDELGGSLEQNEPEIEEDFESICNTQPIESSDDETEKDYNVESVNDIRQKLQNWAISNHITLTALGDLLQILRPSIPNLPKDPRTLLKTPTQYNIIQVCNGEYFHFGLLNGIKTKVASFCPHLPDNFCFQLQLNIDGLPLFKSTNHQFWPILGLIKNLRSDPFVIGIFSGQKKPSNVSAYLNKFKEEYNFLRENGFEFQSKHWHIKLHSIICDAPARAFIKCIKSHSGYKGCDKCEQRGIWVGKMTFPEVNANNRTDESFRQKSDEEHHTGDSPFLETGIGMVSGFPLDYMHLVCLGVMKRILVTWIKGPLNNRIGPRVSEEISGALLALKDRIPSEFARKPRPVAEIDRWKATEFRQFLLYTGPVVLRNKIHSNLYRNFMLFSVSIHFLVNENLCLSYNQYAEDLLKVFVTDFYSLYGTDNAVYNIHCLLHLADDCRKFGSLDTISAFPFENFLHKLKCLIRKPEFALQQVIRRLHEEVSVETEPSEIVTTLHKQHFDGPMLPLFLGAKQFKKVKTEKCTIRLGERDSCVRIQGRICLVQNILQTDDGIFILYHRYRIENDFFDIPLPSQFLGIVKVRRLGNTYHHAKIDDIEAKCILLPCDESSVAFPLCSSIW